MKRKILVIGGCGYIGSNTTRYFDKQKFYVEVVDLELPRLREKNVNYYQGDIMNFELINKHIKEADIIYNFAAVANIKECNYNPKMAIQINILGLNNIVQTCAKYNKRLIYASSVYSLSKHGGIYSITKRTAEELILHYHKEYKLNYTILRFGTIYGPHIGQGNSLYGYIKQAIEEKKIVYNGLGDESREYIHIDDVAKLTADSLNDEHSNQVLMITGIHPYKVSDIFELIKEIIGEEIKITITKDTLKYHYRTSPSNFREIVAQKVVSQKYIDINQGLLDVINNIHHLRTK